MLAVDLLEQAGSGPGSVWVPVIVLGWFLLMTLVGWQVSRRTASAHPDNNPSEFDTH